MEPQPTGTGLDLTSRDELLAAIRPHRDESGVAMELVDRLDREGDVSIRVLRSMARVDDRLPTLRIRAERQARGGPVRGLREFVDVLERLPANHPLVCYMVEIDLVAYQVTLSTTGQLLGCYAIPRSCSSDTRE